MALGIGHWALALGIGHWAFGIRHLGIRQWALGIGGIGGIGQWALGKWAMGIGHRALGIWHLALGALGTCVQCLPQTSARSATRRIRCRVPCVNIDTSPCPGSMLDWCRLGVSGEW